MNTKSEQEKIGYFIKTLREKQGMKQAEFAKALGTSQSAVARMESGKQNFSTGVLLKIGKILNRKIISLHQSLDFVIEGGHKLHGSVTTNYSKNGSVGLLCASLLNKSKTTLHGIARIEEVNRIIEVLQSIGVSVRWIGPNSLEIIPPEKLKLEKLEKKSAVKTRTIVMFMGPLIHLMKKFNIPHASGCNLGKRSISAHIYGLEEMGVKIKVTNDNYEITSSKLKPAEIVMYESGDTACENLIMAAAKIPGKTTIKYSAANYMVQEICFFLQKAGVKIEGIGTTTLTIEGVKEIDKPLEYWNSEDPIESMMFLTAAITTGSRLMIKRCPINFLELELYKLKKMGLKFKVSKTYKSNNERTNLADIEVFPSKLKALDDKIHAQPYPGLNIDNLPFFAAIATQAKGSTMIHDWTYENRAIYLAELNRLGANVTLADPHRVFIEGPTPLKPAQVVCPPALRPSIVLMIAMLAAPGTSILRNVYSINRGYEEIAERFNKIGGNIKVME